MAKFWRKIRNIIHNVPIPGVGITINQGKEIFGSVKDQPGGEVVYSPPVPGAPKAEEPLTGVRVEQKNKWIFYALVGLAVYAVIK